MGRSAIRETGEAAEHRIARSAGLAEDVYEAIFARLMALRIAPGERITVDALAKEFAVSQTPIREALGRLEGEGLVLRTHFVGYRAAPQITRSRFDELYELRLLLEPDAAAKSAAHFAGNARELSALRDLAQKMAPMSSKQDRRHYATFARQDALFHDAILASAGNGLVRETLARLHAHFHIFRLMFHARVTAEALDEHAALLSSLASGDAEGAASAMRRHIERSRDRLLPAFG